jgi:DNA-binding MarR family transcriptional regulator
MTSSPQLTETIRQAMDVFTTRSMHEWSRYVKTTGLSMPQFGILMHLYYRSSCGISHLSEHLDVSAPAASQLVDRLVQHGLLERVEDPHDRRAKQLTLTPKGRTLIETGIVERTRWVDELVQSLAPGEYEEMASALAALTEAVRRLEQTRVHP